MGFTIVWSALVCLLYVSPVHCFMEGIYCGKENCYDVLDVKQDAGKQEIAKAYRRLAKKYHPDVHHELEAKEAAAIKFREIATAYEILKDEDSRADYDYMLEHPEEVYRNYYQYYRRRYAPKVDVRIVIVVTISIISVIQYLSACRRYQEAISYLMTVPKYRLKAVDIAKERSLLDSSKKKKKLSKEELKQEEDNILRKIIEENMDIKGGYAKPSFLDVLWIQLILLPYTACSYVWWYVKWIYKFNIKKEEYGIEEKFYMIRRFLGHNQAQFDSLDETKKNEMLRKELWKKTKFVEWKKVQDEEMRVKLAQSGRMKSYRRYMKNHGPGQITFDD